MKGRRAARGRLGRNPLRFLFPCPGDEGMGSFPLSSNLSLSFVWRIGEQEKGVPY